jgi:hypothetical protein
MIAAAVVGDRIGYTGEHSAPAYVTDRHIDCYGGQVFCCLPCRQPLANLYQIGAHVVQGGTVHVLAERCSACHLWHPADVGAVSRYLASLTD